MIQYNKDVPEDFEAAVYIAENLFKSEMNNEASEKIEILFLSSREINKMILSNKIWNGMTIASWCMYNLLIDAK